MQGDILKVYLEDGMVLAEYEYDAWGKCTVKTNVNGMANVNPFRYRGYYYDVETGLYYLNARYYDPEIGRFISPDSLDYLDLESINGLNLYAYCGNNPVMTVDPSGQIVLSTLIAVMAGIVASSVLSGVMAGMNAAEGESFGSAFLGGVVNSLLSTIGLATGLAVAASGGLPLLIAGGAIATGMGFLGGAVGSITTQAISYGSVDWKVARIAGIISGGFNLISFMGLHMSEMYSTAPKFLQRFAENLKFDIVPIGIAKYLGSLPMFSPNVVRGKI